MFELLKNENKSVLGKNILPKIDKIPLEMIEFFEG